MVYATSMGTGLLIHWVSEHNWEKYYQLKEKDIFVEVGAFIGGYGVIATKI